MTDLLPSGFSFAGSTRPLQYNSLNGRWTIKDIRAGDSLSIQITAVINPVTPVADYTNLAFISRSDGIDPDKRNDTSRFAVNVYDFTAVSAEICAQSSARLQASSVNVINPVFRWYADPGLTSLLHTGAIFETPVLLTNQSFFVTIS